MFAKVMLVILLVLATGYSDGSLTDRQIDLFTELMLTQPGAGWLGH